VLNVRVLDTTTCGTATRHHAHLHPGFFVGSALVECHAQEALCVLHLACMAVKESLRHTI